MTAHGIAPPASAPPAHRDANVLRWLGAHTASVTGDLVYFLALTWTATRVAGPSQMGLVMAAGALPRALFMLGGGVVADRYGPRRVALASDAVRCAVILAVSAAVALSSPSLWLLIPMALVFGVVDAVFMPAVGALPPLIAVRSQLARVQGMRGLSIRLSNAVGPLLAGAVLAVGGAAGALAGAGVLFACSLVLLLTVRTAARPRSAERGPARRELGEGIRYIRGRAMLVPLIVVIALSEMCFSGPVATGLVLLADERGWGASGMGWIAGAFSVGGAAAALLLTVAPRIPHAGPATTGSLLLTAAGTLALGQASSLTAAVLFGALTGLTSSLTSTVTGALIQTHVDPRFLGRVTSVTTLCTMGLSPLLLPAAGVVVAWWGASAFFAGCGAVCLLAAVVGACAPALRRADIRTADACSR